jgi:hypothetical protein
MPNAHPTPKLLFKNKSLSLSSTELQRYIDTRLEEGGKLNIERMCKGESKRSASSQMQKREKKGKLLPSLQFFSSLWFFFFVFFFFCFV